MRADDDWDDDRIAILKSMWADGATAAAIAERFGLSRSAVLGKIFRLRRCAAKTEQAAAQVSCEPAALERRQPGRPGRPGRPRRRGISLLDLTNDTCRWPHGEPGTRGFFFCGAPDADLERGRPYCARHSRRAYSCAANSADANDSPVIAVPNSPSIAPFESPRRYLWRAAVNHPAPRWR